MCVWVLNTGLTGKSWELRGLVAVSIIMEITAPAGNNLEIVRQEFPTCF